MRAYESGVREDASVRVASGASDGPYRLRGAVDSAWPSQGYAHRVTVWQRLGEALRAVLRTILPVLFLSGAFAALYLYMASPVAYFAIRGAMWLSVSAFLLPLAFWWSI